VSQISSHLRTERHSGQRHWMVVVALCALLNALDGYDVMIMSVAAPKLAAEWQIAPGMLGLLLSLETGGMAIGAVVLGQLGDRFGRRPLIILSVAIVTIGMIFSALAHGVTDFAISRLASGLGLGGILTLAPTIAAEFAPEKHRSRAVSIVAGAYAVGAFLGGALAVLLIAQDWRLVFAVGAVATGLMLPAIMLFVGETPEYVASARARAQRSVEGETTDRSPPAVSLENQVDGASGIAGLFKSARAPLTLLLLGAFLANAMTLYFFLKWTPTMVVNLGFEPGKAASVLVWSNGGSVIGAIFTSYFVRYVRPAHAILATFMIAGLAIAGFGFAPADLSILSMIAFVAGLALAASAILFYAVLVEVYPVHLRSGAIGFIMGIGRIGAWISPVIAGLLFSLGAGRGQVTALFGCGSVFAAVAMLIVLLRLKNR